MIKVIMIKDNIEKRRKSQIAVTKKAQCNSSRL